MLIILNKLSINKEEASASLEESIKIEENKIYAPLMIKEINDKLCSFKIAKSRLLRQLARFRKDPEYEQAYDNAVFAYIDDNYAEELPKKIKPINFIPHHLVMVPGKNNHLVYACNTPGDNNTSLNDIMYKGTRKILDCWGHKGHVSPNSANIPTTRILLFLILAKE